MLRAHSLRRVGYETSGSTGAYVFLLPTVIITAAGPRGCTGQAQAAEPLGSDLAGDRPMWPRSLRRRALPALFRPVFRATLVSW